MASVQARHSRHCPFEGAWTPADRSGPKSECRCRPTYYVVVHEGGKLTRERVGKNRRDAERLRDKRSVEVFEGTYQAPLKVSFAEWGPDWLSMLERKPSTVASYRSTIDYAVATFGNRPVGRLRPSDVARFNDVLRDQGLSDSTRAKHLRVLGACLSSAVEHGLSTQNPVRRLPRSERPRPARKESAYFENDELPRLFAEVPDGLYRTLFLLALKTGMRLGELLVLGWADIDLRSKTIRVRRSYTGGAVTTPKNHERRDVDLTDELLELVGAWWGECGRPKDEHLLFPGEGRNGFLDPSNINRRKLYPAMERAGIPREGPTGEKRSFHSFRHTFSKRALESGRQITWLSKHLGHSSLQVTTGVYGHWERAERKRQAELMEGVFGV